MPTLHPYPAYQPSGVPWLGDVPAHWGIERAKWLFQKMDRPVREMDEVITCFRDGTVTLRKNRRELGFTESLKEIGYQGIRHGDLVIHAMDAFAGAIGVSDSDGKGTPVYSVCKPGPRSNAYYYAYTLREMSRNLWIQALAKGIRERSSDFRYTDFGSQFVPLPPMAEQAAIVRYLDYADRRIRRYLAAKQKLIALLEEEKQAVINQAVTRGLDPHVRLKPSGVPGLGDVPAHWEAPTVSKCYQIQLGKMLQNGPASSRDVEVSYLKAQHIQWFSVNTTDAPKMWASPEELETYGIRVGDLLVCEGGEGGRSALVRQLESGYIIQNALHRVRAGKRSRNDYLEYVMKAIAATGWFDAVNSKATIAHFTKEKFSATKIPLPPLSEQAAIVEYLDQATAATDAAIARARRQIELLQEYRTRLIADVVTGQRDVRAAAARLPEAGGPEDCGDAEAIDKPGRIRDNIDNDPEAAGPPARENEVIV